ncbi:hypothetical protein DAPPUDRAFT_311269 [Daphnia pulex]|uniref:DUF4789 domain-containing protein n=1 Tax=Daphnia pulex TaxID=6669 RepID=E9FWE0_DAPPU|nr:hypothetical protein DAPPUDRAFT_311269 [Daphnia pulex]|eukprot:EFX88446.1 hypothetical protein DAPPUDRAFT_311269 [Daphnia pulex]
MNQNIKISHQLSVIQNILFLLLCGLICATHSNTIRAKSHISINDSFTQEITKDWERAVGNRNQEEEGVETLVNTFKSLGTLLPEYGERVEYGDHELTQILLSKIKDIWQLMANNPKWLVNSGESLESLRMCIAKFLHQAEHRNCESPDETFFKGQCLPISTRKRSEYCNDHMGLYDNDENNKGFCDCLELTKEEAKSQLRPIYSNETGFCHRQNTQGPCGIGEWFVLKNTSRCEPVPGGCPSDGRHVYWNPDPSTAKQCWEIWTQGPCEEGQILHLKQYTEAQVSCSFKSADHSSDGSLSNNLPCQPGTYSQHQGLCKSPHNG